MNYTFHQLKPLREKNKDQYQPDEEEVLQYADFLGVNLPEEEYMLELVKEGIIAQLPQQWQACQAPDGQLVYRNIDTNEVQEEHPLDEIYRQKVIELREYVKEHPFQSEESLKTISEKSYEDGSVEANLSSKRNFFVAEPEENNSDLNKGVYLQSSQIQGEKESFNLKKAFSQQKKAVNENEKQNTEELKKELDKLEKEKQMKEQILTYLKMSNELKMEKLQAKLKRKKKK